MKSRVAFEHYDEEVAAMLLKDEWRTSGLPGLLQITTREVEAGRMVATVEAREDLFNPFGSLHGGVVAALIDHVLGAVLYPVIPRGHWAATTEFKLNFLAPVRGGTVAAEAVILSMSKRSAVVRIDATAQDRLVAAAQGTVTIVAPA